MKRRGKGKDEEEEYLKKEEEKKKEEDEKEEELTRHMLWKTGEKRWSKEIDE